MGRRERELWPVFHRVSPAPDYFVFYDVQPENNITPAEGLEAIC
jgi:hypothetical protein